LLKPRISFLGKKVIEKKKKSTNNLLLAVQSEALSITSLPPHPKKTEMPTSCCIKYYCLFLCCGIPPYPFVVLIQDFSVRCAVNVNGS
jgi:hypothetical protein